MNLPNQNILSEVLGETVLSPYWDDTEDSKMWFITAQGNQFINIYELMYLMKEWAMNNSYTIRSELFSNGTGMAYAEARTNGLANRNHTGETESEAVTKACEWILKESK